MQNYGEITFSPLNGDISKGSIEANDNATNSKNMSPPASPSVQEDENTEESSTIGASFNLINSIVGSGIIGIPFAIQQCGLLIGIGMLAFVAYLIYNSVVILIECGVRENKFDFEELSMHLLGIRGYYATLLFMFLFAIGGMTSYLVILADIIPSLAILFAPGTVLTSRVFVLAVVSVVIILPISLLRDLSSLSWTSLLSISADAVIIVIVLAAAFDNHVVNDGGGDDTLDRGEFDATDNGSLFNSQLFAGIGTMSFAFVCQHNSFLVFRSLKAELRNEKKWAQVACYSVFTAFLLCTLLGLAGFFTFYPNTQGDLLNNYPDNSIAISIARMLLAFAMVFTYPMEIFVARHCVLSVYYKWRGGAVWESLADGFDGDGGALGGALSRSSLLEISGMRSTSSPAPAAEMDLSPTEREAVVRSRSTSSTSSIGFAGEVDGTQGATGTDSTSMKTVSLQSSQVPSINSGIDFITRNGQDITIGCATAECGMMSCASGSSDDDANGKESLEITPNSTDRKGRTVPVGTAENPLYPDHVIVTIVLWSFTVAVAMSTDNLGVVTALSGAIAASMIGFVLPGMIYFESYRADLQESIDQVEEKLHGAGRVLMALDLTRVILDDRDLSSGSGPDKGDPDLEPFGDCPQAGMQSLGSFGSDDSYDFPPTPGEGQQSSGSRVGFRSGIDPQQLRSTSAIDSSSPHSTSSNKNSQMGVNQRNREENVQKNNPQGSSNPQNGRINENMRSRDVSISSWDGGAEQSQEGLVPSGGRLRGGIRSLYRITQFYGLVLVTMPKRFRLPLLMVIFGVAAMLIGVVTICLYG